MVPIIPQIMPAYYAPINYLPHYPPLGLHVGKVGDTCPKGGEFDLILEIIF